MFIVIVSNKEEPNTDVDEVQNTSNQINQQAQELEDKADNILNQQSDVDEDWYLKE